MRNKHSFSRYETCILGTLGVFAKLSSHHGVQNACFSFLSWVTLTFQISYATASLVKLPMSAATM